MKSRAYRIVIILLILQLLLSSCHSEKFELYKTYIEDVSNGASAAVDSKIWSTFFTKENKVGSSRTVSYNGVQYIGQYDNSLVKVFTSYETDYYKTESGIDFGVNSQTGDLVYLNLMTNEYFETEPYLDDVADPAGTALALAKSIAKDFVDDISEYEITIDEPYPQYKKKDGRTYTYYLHDIWFMRKIQGYNTSDRLYIRVTSKGNLAQISLGDINAFKGKTISFDVDKVNTSISDKVKKAYENTSCMLTDFTVGNQYICKLPNGQICIHSNVPVKLKNQSTPLNGTLSTITVID